MSRCVLYAYVDGNDLHEVESFLVERLSTFIESREWICTGAKVVNQHGDPNDPSLNPEDLPDWDIGLNITLPDPGKETPGWFADIEDAALFLGQLHRDTGRDFVIGIGDTTTGVADDLFFVNSSNPDPDLFKLRQIIGVGDVS